MDARGYRGKPKSYFAALLFGGAAVALFVLGLVLDALPEHGVGEWNGLPLGEYGTSDLLPTTLFLAFVAIVFAGVALRRGVVLGRGRRVVLIGFISLAGLGIALTILYVAFAIAVCSTGACE
jgi:hypothetical protein